MRSITLRYGGECRKCGTALAANQIAGYEKRVGVFCAPCTPTATEEIREYRQESGDRRAEKYEGWAAKRQERARATLVHNERFTGDIAFNTQPGHIPFRARIIAQNDRACESLETARRFEGKAERLRHVVVAGDKERKRQAKRDAIRPLLKPGVTVDTGLYGRGIIKKVNRKTATIDSCGQSRSFCVAVDLSWLTIEEGQYARDN